MKNVGFNLKILGIILILIAIGLFFITFSFTQTLMSLRLELHEECPLPPEACPYKASVPVESLAGFVLAITIGILGAIITLTTTQTQRSLFQERKKRKGLMKSLEGEERKIYNLIVSSDGFMFQSDLIKKSGFSKVKVSRILDRLETKDIVERRRRGMANVVILKY